MFTLTAAEIALLTNILTNLPTEETEAVAFIESIAHGEGGPAKLLAVAQAAGKLISTAIGGAGITNLIKAL
jgi:hypothetical protein